MGKIEVSQKDSIPGIPLPKQDKAKTGYVEAIVNAGRWVVRCPDDPEGKHFGLVDFGQQHFICPGCYPDTMATAFQKREDDLFIPVPDAGKRIAAKDNAEKDSQRYTIIFPANAAAIMDTLRQRPAQAMNWHPEETVEYLEAENIAHGVSITLPDITIVEGGE